MKVATKRRAPRLSREAQRELKTEAILEGAWVTFCKKGYEAVTLDEVAEYAGVSRMPVYWLFGDKQNLFFELWKKVIADLLMQIGAQIKAGAPLRRNLETLARLTAEGQASDQPRHAEGLFFVVQTIALSRADIAEKLLQVSNEVVERFAGFVSDSVLEEGQQLRGPVTTVAAHLVAQINGLSTVQFQTHRQFVKARDLVEIFTAIALKGPAG